MKELNLHEEIIKSLKLITYDRSLTLNEQVDLSEDWAEDLLGPVKHAPKIDHEKIKNEKIKLFGKDNKRWGVYQYQKIDEIKKLLNYLIDKKKLKYDGVVDLETTNTIKSLQKKYGLSPTGIIDQKTFDMFNKQFKIKKLENQQKRILKSKKDSKEIQLNCKSLQNKSIESGGNKKTAALIYQVIMQNVSQKGTEEQDILGAIKQIKNYDIYKELSKIVLGCTGAPSIMAFIQSTEFSKGSNLSRLPFLPYQIQWQFNDKWLYEYQKILTKYNEKERYETEIPTNIWQTMIPPFTREAMHAVLPLVSFALMLLPGGQTLSGLLIATIPDVLDAGVYMLADKDPYMAGLTLMFALVSVIPELPISAKAAKYGSSIIKKFSKKEFWKLTDEELEVVNDMNINSVKYEKYAENKLIQLTLKNITDNYFKTATPKGIAAFIDWAIRRGYLVANAGKKIVLNVGGTTVTWDFIASMVGLGCNKTFSFSDIFKEFGYDKMSQIVAKLQSFTKTKDECEKVKLEKAKYLQKKLEEKLNFYKNNFDELLIENIKYMISKKIYFSISNNYEFFNGVVFIQCFLKQFEKISSMSKIKTNPINKIQKDVFKWGVFNGYTKSIVEKYQELNRVPINGVLDSKTLNLILNDIKTKKYGKIKNYYGKDLTKSSELVMKTITYNEYIKNINDIIKDQKDKVDEEIDNKREDLQDQVDSLYVIDNRTDTIKFKYDFDQFKKNNKY